MRKSQVLLVLALMSFSGVARSEVTRIEITAREPFADGHEFGTAGAYEKLVGRLYVEVLPDDPANGRIVDLKLAPRNDRDRVEFWTDFFLLKPVDVGRGNGRLMFGVNNRGNKLLLGAFNNRGGNNPTTLADAGNGFLMRHGYSILWCGWNGDVLPGGHRLVTGIPVAQRDGKPLTGLTYTEICVDSACQSQPLCPANTDVYPTVSLDNSVARLTVRPRRSQSAVEIPRDKWSFARVEDGKPVPDPTSLYLVDGFEPGCLYELVYEAQGPRVTGLGFAAVRDAVSFFRNAKADAHGVGNPLEAAIQRAYVFGISQSGRFIHHFIFEGFNSDEQKRIVFDGAIPHVGGGGKGNFNFRFAQTTRYGSQLEENLFPSDFFPFTSTMQEDPVTGRKGDMLARARELGNLPKILFTETSTEYWCRAASLLHTDVAGTRDVPLDSNVRLYLISGAQHVVSGSPTKGIYKYGRNILDHRPALRALLVALDAWVTDGTAPPPSRYPRIDDGTLVDVATWRQQFPAIPGIALPESCYTPCRLDFGARWLSEGVLDKVPPEQGEPFRTLVPAVDADGNEVAGIRLPDVAVPRAAYAGWNVRGANCGGEGLLSRYIGSYFPFQRTGEERRADGDPRPAVTERYPTRQAYLDRVAAAARELQEEGFLLEEDVTAIQRTAASRRLWEP